jgi:nucleoside-triphosphatase THEP1
MRREALVEALYERESLGDPSAALRGALAKLRSRVPAGLVRAGGGLLGIDEAVADVDLWTLLDAVDTPGDRAVTSLLDLIEGMPFDDAKELAPLQPTLRLVMDARIALIDHLATERVEELPKGALLAVAAMVRRSEPHEPLTVATARLLAAADDIHGAVDLIDHHLRLVAAEGDVPGATKLVASFRRELLTLQLAPAVETLVAPELAVRRHPDLIGRDAVVGRLVAGLGARTPVVAITGDAGMGKTAVAAEVAHCLGERGVRSHYVAATGHSETAFTPFVHCLTDLRQGIVDLITQEPESDVGRYRVWRHVHEGLTAQGSATLLVLDDVELYDDQSLQLAEFLCRSAAPQQLLVLIVGSGDHPLIKVSPVAEVVAPLKQAQAESLVAEAFPTTASLQRRHLASDLLSASQGRPAELQRLLDAVDPDHLVLPPDSFGAAGSRSPFQGLSATAVETAGALAVLGADVGLDALGAALRANPVDVLAALDELFDAGLIIPSGNDVWRLVSERARREILERLDPEAAHRFHFAALRDVGDDVHRRAWHLEALAGMVDSTTAAVALVQSARRHLTVGNPRQAAERFRRATLLDATVLDVDALIDYAAALDLSGGTAQPVRTQAFSRALAADQPSAALRAALSGLPAAARTEGDEDRVMLLKRLPHQRLDDRDRFAYHSELARQSLFVGRGTEARLHASTAVSLAADADERAQAWVNGRHIGGWVGDDEPPDASDLKPATRARVCQALLSAALADGALDAVRQAALRLDEATEIIDDPLRRWYSLMLGATVLEETGDWTRATAASKKAAVYGLRWGVSIAAASRAAQAGARALLTGRMPDFTDHTQHNATDIVSPALSQAVAARFLHLHGRRATAATRSRLLLQETRGSRFRVPTIAVLAPILRDVVTRSELRSLHDEVQQSPGRRIIIGAGVVSLGPVMRTLAHLTTGRNRRSYLEQAVAAADDYGSPHWRVVTRVDLAQEVSAPDLIDEASAIAGPSPLVPQFLATDAEVPIRS